MLLEGLLNTADFPKLSDLLTAVGIFSTRRVVVMAAADHHTPLTFSFPGPVLPLEVPSKRCVPIVTAE